MGCEVERLGFVTGMVAEARCLGTAGLPDALVYCSGASPIRAAAGAAALIAQGATVLVSFGLAGGLDPALRPGDLVLADSVILPDGGRIETDRTWRARLAGPAIGPDTPDGDAGVPRPGPARPAAACDRGAPHRHYRPRRAVVAPLAGSDRAVASAAEKRTLFESTGAVAVDMESHAVAAAARAAGVPLLVLRAIADPAERPIPTPALAGLGPDGRTRPLAVAARLLAAPWHLPGLLRLAADSRAALVSLRQALHHLG